MNATPGRTRPSAGLLAWRFVSGSHLGRRTTNRTFLHAADTAHSDHAHTMRASFAPGWKHSLYRNTGALTLMGAAYGQFADPAVMHDAALSAILAGAVAGAVRARFAIMNARHHRRVVRPLHEMSAAITAASSAGARHAVGGSSMVSVPRNYRHPAAEIVFRVPPTWEAPAADIKRLIAAVEARCGGEWQATARMHAWPPKVVLTHVPAPPAKVAWADIAAAVQRAAPGELVLGVSATGPVTVDIDTMAPHVGISAGTGAGKSSLYRAIMLQLLGKPDLEQLTVCDVKRVSLAPFRGVRRVDILTTVTPIFDAIMAFEAEVHRRYDDLEKDPSATFGRRVLVIEEMGSMISALADYWEDYRNGLSAEERRNVAKKCPAIGALYRILNLGRQAKMHVILATQRASSNAVGGADLRENVGCWVLSRYSRQTWMMLVGTTPVPKSSRAAGRVRVVIGDSDRECQAPFVSEDETRVLAAEITRARADGEYVQDEPEPDPEPLLTLRELCSTGAVEGIRYAALKRARTRAGDQFPEGQEGPHGRLYRASEITSWLAERGQRVAV